MKKKILVIGTGGTIASTQSESGLVPGLTADDLMTHVPDAKELADIDAIQVCNLDSTDVTPKDWMLFASTIEENYHAYDGFVLCHGTDTLAYTAAALSYLIQNSRKPIVITGSQKPIDAQDTDARRNLRDSILYACDQNSHLVSIVFDGKVIAGTRAKKEKSKSFDAFSSINFPYLALIRDGRVIRYIYENKEDLADPTFAHRVSSKVFALKLAPGFNKSLLPVLFEQYDCIIIESFGLGGIPSYLMEEFKAQMDSHNTLIIVSTQVANEGSDMSIYQVGLDAKSSFNLLETYDMTMESAYAKACWLLGLLDSNKKDPGTLGLGPESIAFAKKEFYRSINHDLLEFA